MTYGHKIAWDMLSLQCQGSSLSSYVKRCEFISNFMGIMMPGYITHKHKTIHDMRSAHALTSSTPILRLIDWCCNLTHWEPAWTKTDCGVVLINEIVTAIELIFNLLLIKHYDNSLISIVYSNILQLGSSEEGQAVLEDMSNFILFVVDGAKDIAIDAS